MIDREIREIREDDSHFATQGDLEIGRVSRAFVDHGH
jgi:hypothetical protein